MKPKCLRDNISLVAATVMFLLCCASLVVAQPSVDPIKFGLYMKNDPCVENRNEWIVVGDKNPTGGLNSYLTAFGSRVHQTLGSAQAEANTLRTLLPAAETGLAAKFKNYCCNDWNIWTNTQTGTFAAAKAPPGPGWIRDVTSPSELCCEEAFALLGIAQGCRDVTLSNGDVLRFTLVDGSFTFVAVGNKPITIPGLPGKLPRVILPEDGVVDQDTVIEIPPPIPGGDITEGDLGGGVDDTEGDLVGGGDDDPADSGAVPAKPPDDPPAKPSEDPKPQQPATGARWVLQETKVSPEPYKGWSYSSGGSSATYVPAPGYECQFNWTKPPQEIDSKGFTMSVSVQSTPPPNASLAAIIGITTSGFDSDNLPAEQTVAYAKAENGTKKEEKTLKLLPRDTATDLEIKVSFMWAINFTYIYRLAP